MASIDLRDILKLSVEDRLRLIEDIWESIAAHPEALPLTDAQKAELDRRLLDYRNNPGQGRTWEEVRDSLDKS